jgi:hypothetical protein
LLVSALVRFFSRARVCEESGWLMMEIMVGAVALVITGLAIYKGLDGAAAASGRNRDRTTAAFVAQQDQERMRALDVSALSAYVKTPRNSQVVVGGITYKVTSSAAFLSNNTGAASCTSASALATYLRISSTVTDPANQNRPVTIDSLVSPRASQGGAAVQIVDRTGTTGVPGIPVGLDEDASRNDTTDANGCVQFGYLNGTSYHVSFSKAGYVDWNGNNVISNKPITVVKGRSTLTQFNYDVAGAITASTATSYKDANATSTTVTPTGGTPPITVWHNQATTQKDNSSVPPVVSSLFPFTSGYVVFAGCKSDDPAQWSQPAPGTAVVTPGATVTATGVTLPKVTITARVTSNGTTFSNLSNPDVWLTDQRCGTQYHLLVSNNTNVAPMYVPYGDYDVCVDNGNTGTADKATTTIANHAAGGASNTVTVDTRTTNAFCP